MRDLGGTSGITVSTLEEAEYFFADGFDDILYAVGMAEAKVERAAGLIRAGCRLSMVTDNLDIAARLARAAVEAGVRLPLLIEIDVDGHRSGIAPLDDHLLTLAYFIYQAPSLELRGVMTHAGESYTARSADDRLFHATREVEGARAAAERIRSSGLPCDEVSIGSTPTAVAYTDLTGITEVRAGVYAFFDLAQAGIGSGGVEDIAVSVLTTVIGHQAARHWVITDSGWMSLSRDRSTADQAVDLGYGLVCDIEGRAMGDVIVISANQEHGIIAARPNAPPLLMSDFPVGRRLRVLPNHACATAAQFGHYDVVRVDGSLDRWDRLRPA